MGAEKKTEKLEYVNGLSERMSFAGVIPSDESILPVESLGKGLLLLEDKNVYFNRKRAEELLKLPEFIVNESEVDRALRDAHVTYLLSAMKRGTFHPEWVQIITCVCDEKNGTHSKGTEYRMNGQHTAWARVYMDEDWDCPVRWMIYRAKTTADMRRLYASIDRAAPRTFGNVLNSYLAGTDQFQGASQDTVKRIATGYTFWKAGDYKGSNASSKIDADDLAFRIQTENVDLTKIVTAYILSLKGSEQRLLFRRAPVIGALYETFSVLKIHAADFWDSVRDGTGMESRSDPRLRLRSLLTSTAIEQRPGSRRRVTTPEEMYRCCIHAWNAWRRGATLASLCAPTDCKRPKAK